MLTKKNLLILSTLFAIFALSGCSSSSVFLIKGQSSKDPNITTGKSVGANRVADEKGIEKFADVKQELKSKDIGAASNRNVFENIKDNFCLLYTSDAADD